MRRLTTLMTALVLGACPQDPGDESGGTATTGASDPVTSTGETSEATTTTADTTTTTTEATTGPTTGEATTSTATTDDPTGGACGLPPLPDEVIETLGFNVFGSTYEGKPGDTLALDVGAIECCYIKNPVEACVEYSVTPTEGVTITADGQLTIAADAVPGTKYTVTADVEAGRKVLTTQVYVYTPETNPFVGIWHEVAQLPCGGGADVTPEVAIQELWFRASGEVLVTWMPFEVYVDYWSDYTFDLMTGELDIVPESGNYLPDDVDGSGTFALEGGQLVLSDMWLGSPQSAMSPAQCGHRFER